MWTGDVSCATWAKISEVNILVLMQFWWGVKCIQWKWISVGRGKTIITVTIVTGVEIERGQWARC